ncbi:MAG: glycosyltransferase [Pseudomonadota bacterium]|nr:glycosyltransferase [Pseudomonadota bacterium]
MLFLADLPYPLHGMSNVNKKMLEKLKFHCDDVKVINTSPSYFSKYFNTKLWVACKIIHSIIVFAKLFNFFIKGERIVYRPIMGGIGQVYDCIYLLLARIFRARIVLHHHSFQYLNEKKRLFSFLKFIAGPDAEHVLLGPEMLLPLNKYYAIREGQCVVVSNLCFFDVENVDVRVNATVTIGHLANLCYDKGVDYFCSLYEVSEKNAGHFKFVVAGPYADKETKALIEASISNNFEYHGPLYGEAKDIFYNGLDVFLFMSKYKNEAEPLVLYEAAQQGAFLIGTNRGCMASVIEKFGGLVVNPEQINMQELYALIEEKRKNGCFGFAQKKTRSQIFKRIKSEGDKVLDELIASFT